ncbi:MAG TPA: DUF4214 domain-containing protein [Pirellulales bacterium]|nr:DUF4214 domain-containing protein [Pirellulales bacterium]
MPNRKSRRQLSALERLEHRTLLSADLAIVNVASPATAVVAGNVVQYNITVSNSGTDATNTVVTDQLPTGETFLGLETPNATNAPNISYNLANNTVTFNAGTILGGGTGSVTANVYALINSTANGTLTNTAAAYSPDDTSHSTAGSAVTSQQQNSVNALGSNATDLAIAVTAANNNAAVNPGGIDNVVYTVVVKNNGSNTATGVKVTDYLPASFAGTNTSEPAGVTVTFPQSDVAQATLPDLAAGQSETFTITFDGPDTPPGALVNTAFVTSANGDINPSDNVATNVTPVTPVAGPATVDLSVSQSTSPSLGAVNQPLTYTVTVTNNSASSDATNVYLTDLLPAGTILVSGATSVSGVNVTVESGSVVSVLFPTLAKQTSATVTLTVTPTATGTITNSAYVESGVDMDTTQSNNAISNQTTVNATALAENYLAGTPGNGSDATFISNLYHELLGRAADAGGQVFWQNFLQTTGANGRTDAVIVFLNSYEYRTQLVTTVYENLLHRAPDTGGLQFWASALGTPGTPSSQGMLDEKLLIAGIAGSNEYYADAGNTDQGWVDHLYADLMGRTADSGGQTYWIEQAGGLTAITRSTLVVNMLNTAEVENKLLNAAYPGTQTSPTTGTPVGGSYALADMTGGGWENLYLEGAYNASPDPFLVQLASQASWDSVIVGILESSQFYTNSN